jgi:hypothetical protein
MVLKLPATALKYSLYTNPSYQSLFWMMYLKIKIINFMQAFSLMSDRKRSLRSEPIFSLDPSILAYDNSAF